MPAVTKQRVRYCNSPGEGLSECCIVSGLGGIVSIARYTESSGERKKSAKIVPAAETARPYVRLWYVAFPRKFSGTFM